VTAQEHLFMMSMYARQSAKFNVLCEILKTRGILEEGDLSAFLAHTAQETKEHQEWLRASWKTYQSTAADLGVTTGLGDPPTPEKT
jgi:hypothetical protein